MPNQNFINLNDNQEKIIKLRQYFPALIFNSEDLLLVVRLRTTWTYQFSKIEMIWISLFSLLLSEIFSLFYFYDKYK